MRAKIGLVFVIIFLLISCEESTSPDKTISILDYLPLKNNSEIYFLYTARTECYYVNYHGTAVWKITEQDPSQFNITEIRSGYKYGLDELENPIGDTTYWGPDSSLFEITISNDSLTFKKGYPFIKIPKNIKTTKDTIKIIDIYSEPHANDYDVSGYVRDVGFQVAMEWVKDIGPYKMNFLYGQNCRTSENYILLDK